MLVSPLRNATKPTKQVNINQKNGKLIAQYPFLQHVLDGLGTKWLHFDVDKVSRLNISVERADNDLMFRYGRCFGLSNGPNTQYKTVDGGRRNGLLMRQHEYLVSVKNDLTCKHHYLWSDYFVPDKFLHFVQDCMFNDIRFFENGEKRFGDSIANKIQNLIWVRCQVFHKPSGDEMLPYGDLVEIDVCITVYNKPKDYSFAKLCTDSNIFEHLITDEKILQTGVGVGNPTFSMMQGMLMEMCQNLVDNVWNSGFKEMFLRDATGLRSRFKELKWDNIIVECRRFLGDITITIKDTSENEIVLMSRPDINGDYTSFFVHKYHGKLPSIRKMVYAVIKRYKK